MKKVVMLLFLFVLISLTGCSSITNSAITKITSLTTVAPTSTISTATTINGSDLSNNITISFNDSFTDLWTDDNKLKLDNVIWSDLPMSGSPYKWQTGVLTVYLKNDNNVSVRVTADSSEKPGYIFRGYSASSEEIIIKSKSTGALNITIDYSPDVYQPSDFGGFLMYFHYSAWQ